jgi:hypothetical protein
MNQSNNGGLPPAEIVDGRTSPTFIQRMGSRGDETMYAFANRLVAHEQLLLRPAGWKPIGILRGYQ